MSKLSSAPLPERVVAVSALGAGAAIAVTGASYGLAGPTGVGPGLFPAVAGAAMTVAGLSWTARLLRGPAGSGAGGAHDTATAPDGPVPDGPAAPDRAGLLRVAIVATALLGAALVLETLGYTLTVTLMITAVLVLVSRRTWWTAVLVALGAALASRLVFEGWLGTSLPTAGFGPLAWLGL